MISLTRNSGRSSVLSFLLYHLGRLLVYVLIGVFFGLFSSSVQLFTLQKHFAILLGILILAIFAFPRIRNRFEGWYCQSFFYQKLKTRLTGYYSTRFRWLAAGALNGMLPCGLVYLAAAGAMISGSITGAIYSMLLFGLGTLPILVMLRVLRIYLPEVLAPLSNVTTTIALISGVLLIVRGLTIENPDINGLITAQISDLVSICGF